MRDPVLSLRVWSFYVLGIGAGLLLVPNLIFDLFGIANTSEVWIRVAGLVAVALGIVYFSAAREGVMNVVRSSIPARAAAVLSFVALWATGGPWQLLLFGVIDLTGLAWTWNALRTTEPAPSPAAS